MTAREGAAEGLLLDVEGVTTPVRFVYDVLFPFAEARLAQACARAADDPEFAAAIERLRAEHAAECDPARPEFGDGAGYAGWLMAQDRKSTGLKELQGLIWREGYAAGELRGEVFDDVPAALERARERGLSVRIFSSGSVLAQKLLFAHSTHGDLTPWLDGFHDTTTGSKKEPDSYRRIAKAFDLPPRAVLFVSDSPAELEAATDAGMQVASMVRPGNAKSEAAFPRYESLLELPPLR